MKSASSSGPHRMVGAELHRGNRSPSTEPTPSYKRVDRLVDHRQQECGLTNEGGGKSLGDRDLLPSFWVNSPDGLRKSCPRSRSRVSPPRNPTGREKFIGIHFMNPVPVMELVRGDPRHPPTEDKTFEGRPGVQPRSSVRRSRSSEDFPPPSSSTAIPAADDQRGDLHAV